MTTLKINGKTTEVTATPDTPLLWVLRDHLGLTGSKFGCGGGFCGACTVHLDGKAVKGCQTPLGEVGQRAVTTIEGVGAIPAGREVQKAWIALGVPQCGYCQAGQVMRATALLLSNARPSDAQIDDAMDGNLCRCGTYTRIRTAIKQAAGLPGDAA